MSRNDSPSNITEQACFVIDVFNEITTSRIHENNIQNVIFESALALPNLENYVFNITIIATFVLPSLGYIYKLCQNDLVFS